ncbi:MAG TPA: hypothetical protein VFG23_22665 [Polyangia bacterium]|nr:hypothetical protein [Polyangia bacterium]
MKMLLLSLALLATIPITAPAQSSTSRIGVKDAGAYDPAQTYTLDDMVLYSGVEYLSRVTGNIANTPSSSPTQWLSLGGGSPSAATIAAALVSQSGCNTSGNPWDPATNTCPVPSGFSGVLQPLSGGTGIIAGPPLNYWDAAFHNCRNQIVRVLLPDDSRTISDTTVIPGVSGLAVTFGNKWADQLRTQLQSMCGSHGTGIVPFVPVWNTAALNTDYFAGAAGSWTTDAAIGPYQNSGGGNVGTTLKTTSTMTIPFSTTQLFDHLLMYCASGPGLNAWTLKVDGVSVGTCGGTAGSLTATLATSSAVTLATHSAQVVCATSPCEGYAVEAAAGSTGASVDNIAVGSCAAECFGLAPSTQLAFSDLAPGGEAAVILSTISNEPGIGYSTSSFSTALTNTITHERGLTYPPSILIYAPLQDGISGQSTYYPILSTVASAQSTAYFDMRDRWGTSLVSFLFGSDTYHENNNGNGEVYSRVASTLLDTPAAGVPSITCPSGQAINAISPLGASCAVFSGGGGGGGSCGSGFSHYAPITIASSNVSGGTDLSSFPILLAFNGAATNSLTLTNLKTVANGGQVQTGSGVDVIFCSAATGGTQYSHELVTGSYVASTGAGEWYVSVPTLSASTTTTIYAFWGNSLAADTSAPNSVWSNYDAVYHMGTASSLGLSDSTGNGNTLTNTSSATATGGQFGGAASLTSSQVLNDATPAIAPPSGAAQRTIEAWVKFPTVPATQSILFGYGNNTGANAWSVIYDPTAGLGMWESLGSETEIYTGDTSWHHMAAVLPSGQSTIAGGVLYLDGAALTTMSCTGTCSGTLTTVAANIQVNGVPSLGGTAMIAEKIDEYRIARVGLTAGWIATQYANQSNPAAFETVGTVH